MSYKFMDFCAGIGGGRIGLEKNGLQCVAFSEINKNAITTYNILHNSENEINFGDLTKIDSFKLPDFEFLIAGFPCQTFSVMGKRKGFEDDRGQIIYGLIKIIKEKKVPYFILENVKGLINHDNGNTIKVIKQELEDIGYHVEYRVMTSLEYGVPQMRERVYFVGIKKEFVFKEKKFYWPEKVKKPDLKNYLIDDNNIITESALNTFNRYLNNKYNKGKFEYNKLLEIELSVLDTRQSDLRIYSGKVPTLRTGRQGILYVRDGKLRNLTGYEGLLLQGFDMEYANKVKNKISDRYLLAQVGNAMTVNPIAYLCDALLKYIGK